MGCSSERIICDKTRKIQKVCLIRHHPRAFKISSLAYCYTDNTQYKYIREISERGFIRFPLDRITFNPSWSAPHVIHSTFLYHYSRFSMLCKEERNCIVESGRALLFCEFFNIFSLFRISVY